MLFNSVTFLIFISIFLPLFFVVRGRMRLWLSLLASYLFYGWWDWRFLGLVLFSTLLDYYLGHLIANAPTQQKRKTFVTLSVIVNLGFLGFFKYFNFFAESISAGLTQLGFAHHWNLVHIILPVGISFYTFQSMSYTIDIYKRKITPETDLLRFATFVSFFPQLVAGPIVRAEVFLPQLDHDHTFNPNRFLSGLTQILIGFLKKIAVADTLAIIVDRVYDNPGSFPPLMIVVGCIFYSFQIYCDFSGYSDIAIGLARIMGYEFPMNFKAPYFSKSFSEFWTRWHISLSGWLRDYLYIPLGGNRKGELKTYRNLMLTMLIGGLWHGANWTFIIWGALHGFYLVVQRLMQPITKIFTTSKLMLKRLGDLVCITFVFLLTTFAWIFFRSQNLSEAFYIINSIATIDSFSFGDLMFLFPLSKGIILILFILLLDGVMERIDLFCYMEQRAYKALAFFVFLILIIAFLGTFDNQQFIYFQF